MNFNNPGDIAAIKNLMRRLVAGRITSECWDRTTNEINCTKLAEEAALILDLYEDHVDYNIPEEMFDFAVEVAAEFEE